MGVRYRGQAMRLRRLAHVYIHLRVHAGLYIELSLGRVGGLLQGSVVEDVYRVRGREGGTLDASSDRSILSFQRRRSGRLSSSVCEAEFRFMRSVCTTFVYYREMSRSIYQAVEGVWAQTNDTTNDARANLAGAKECATATTKSPSLIICQGPTSSLVLPPSTSHGRFAKLTMHENFSHVCMSCNDLLLSSKIMRYV